MLINLRNALMAGKRLPYDAEVEYLRVDAVGPYIVIDGVTYCNAVGTYYAFTISSGGVVTHDLISVRLGNTGYMYDRITNKRFGNAGTGDFVLGPDVVPVEYIESHGTEYIDTGFKASNSTRVAVDFESTNSTVNRWILGARNGAATATDKFALFYGNSSYAMIGSATGEFSGATIKTGRHLLDMSLAGGVVVDSQIVATYSASEQAEVFSAAYAMVLFNLWNGSLNSPFIGKYYACKFWDNGNPVRKFLPVRVGTDATSWKGAMIDTLTRRIYRNAGTGAFTYGNDLKYPIPSE